MFVNRDLIRRTIFACFCVLILAIGLILSYIILILDNEMTDLEYDTQAQECRADYMTYVKFSFKIIFAFTAGAVVSDLKWIRFGTF